MFAAWVNESCLSGIGHRVSGPGDASLPPPGALLQCTYTPTPAATLGHTAQLQLAALALIPPWSPGHAALHRCHPGRSGLQRLTFPGETLVSPVAGMFAAGPGRQTQAEAEGQAVHPPAWPRVRSLSPDGPHRLLPLAGAHSGRSCLQAALSGRGSGGDGLEFQMPGGLGLPAASGIAWLFDLR